MEIIESTMVKLEKYLKVDLISAKQDNTKISNRKVNCSSVPPIKDILKIIVETVNDINSKNT